MVKIGKYLARIEFLRYNFIEKFERSLRMKGKVKWFNAEKGYGFIISEEGKEVFVHYSSIVAEGYKSLNEGEEVTFEVVEGDKGQLAKDVHRA